MNDFEPWKIWALTAVLVVAILGSASAKLKPVAVDLGPAPAEAPPRINEPSTAEQPSAYASFEASAPRPSIRYYNTAPTVIPPFRTNVSVDVVDTADVSDVPDDNLVAVTSNLDSSMPEVADVPQHIWNYSGNYVYNYILPSTDEVEPPNFTADYLISNTATVANLAWQEVDGTVSDMTKAIVDEIMPANYANTVDGRIDAAAINYVVGKQVVQQINNTLTLNDIPATVQLDGTFSGELAEEARQEAVINTFVRVQQLAEVENLVALNYAAPGDRQNPNAQLEFIDLYDLPVENL